MGKGGGDLVVAVVKFNFYFQISREFKKVSQLHFKIFLLYTLAG